jgi:predicted MPP superfamily phosphohydrolase
VLSRLAWATDIHLNFLSVEEVEAFCHRISALEPHALVVSGDIAEGPTIKGYLELLAREIERPIYFVLGNHDFYRSSIRRVRRIVSDLCREHDGLVWLGGSGVVELSSTVGLLGHDGWADGRIGSFFESKVVLNDYVLIEELSELSTRARFERLNALGDEAADHLRTHLPGALERYEKVYVVTHVPPFREACWYLGEPSNDEWLPHFACRAVGDVLSGMAAEFPSREVTVLCGHTHGRGVARLSPNLVVRTGGAAYGEPVVEEVIDIGSSR